MIGVQFHSSSCEYIVFPSPIPYKTILSWRSVSGLFIYLCACVYFWAQRSVPLVNGSVSPSEPNCSDYNSFIIKFGIKKSEVSRFILFSGSSDFSGSFVVHKKILQCFFCFSENFHWNGWWELCWICSCLLGRKDILTILVGFVYENGMSFHFVLCQHFFFNVFKFSSHRTFTALVRCIHKCFIIFMLLIEFF